MVFALLAGLFSILSSSLVYIAATFFFAKSEKNLVALLAALVVIQLILFIVRMFSARSRYKMKHAASMAHSMGGVRRRFNLRFKHAMERRLISGNIARIIAFGTIAYLALGYASLVYSFAIFALATAVIMLFAHKSKFIDIILGAILGFVVGLLSLQYSSLIMNAIGF